MILTGALVAVRKDIETIVNQGHSTYVNVARVDDRAAARADLHFVHWFQLPFRHGG